MGGQLPREPHRGTPRDVSALATAMARLGQVTREQGTGWRRRTPPEITEAVDAVLKAWRASQR